MQPATDTATDEDVLGSRVVAALIDILLLFALAMVLSALSGGVGPSDKTNGTGVSVELSGFAFILWFLSALVYYFVFETLYGQTLGKRVMKLRVRSLRGRLGPHQVLVRTLLRIVDVLPVFYLLGFLVVLATQPRRRIGDLAAGTVVVRA